MPVVNALFFLWMGATGFGLWRLLPWARNAIIAASFLGVCSGIERLIEFRYAHTCRSVDLTNTLLSSALLYYFARPRVKQVFNGNSPAPAQLS
jgi:hypothetical protein